MADTLHTARLVLRPLRQDDAEALHHFFRDPVAMAFFDQPHATPAETAQWVRGTLKAPPDETREYTILRDGAVIGKAGIWRRPELGYFLLRDHWSQGLMTEALTALIPHLHASMACPIITAQVTPENTTSTRLLRRLGFRTTRVGQQDFWDGQKWCDTAYFERQATDPIKLQDG